MELKTERRTGVTRQLLQILQDNKDQVLTTERLAELTDYDRGNVNTLIHQLRRNKPNLIIEVPTSGAFIFRGTKSVNEITGDDVPEPIEVPVRKARAVKAVAQPTPASPTPFGFAIGVGELVEVIGYGQDGTPLVRDTAGRIYLLQPL